MSENNCNVGGIEVLENVLIVSSKAALGDHSVSGALGDPEAKAVADRPLHSDPVSPATAVPKKGVDIPADDEPKVIHNLEIATLHNNGNEAVEVKIVVKDANSAQTECTAEAKPSVEVETVRISNADSSNEVKQVFLHNNRIKNAKNSSDEENFEVVEIIGAPTADLQTPKNPLGDVSSDELLAILEGDVDSTTAKTEAAPDDTEQTQVVFEVKYLEDEQPASTQSPFQDEVRKIAQEQMLSLKGKRGRPETKSKPVSELVSSLVSDWSDTEKDSELPVSKLAVAAKPKSAATALQKVMVLKKKPVQTTKKSESVVTPFKPTRIIKKKIIWDPDAPETQISYASLVKSSATPKKQNKATVSRPVTPPPQKPESPQISLIKTKANVQVSLLKPKMEHISLLKPKAEQIDLLKPKPIQQSAASQPPKMRILNTGKRSSTSPPRLAQSKRKRITEIDRLLNDEGAANMLNTLESDDTVQKAPRAKKTPTPVPTPAEKSTKKDPTPKKRVARSSATASWDYVYNQRNVDSLIIRRRSNSSYSSTTSPRRLSVEKKTVNQSRGVKGKSKSFEFAKPENKKVGKKSPGNAAETLITEDIKKTEARESTRKSNRTPVPIDSKETQSKANASSIEATNRNSDEVTIKRHGNVVQMILKTNAEKLKGTFSVQLMNEVVRQLDIMERDSTCKVLMINSAGLNFCQGVDFFALAQGSIEKRKNYAQELASTVTSFLNALISFPKPLIAGIVGACSGIGVTMLPIFDIVICSDKSTFETPYAKIGQLPEGHCILTSTNNVRHSFKIKLLLLCDKINSTEAALSGLVTKLSAPSKVVEDTLQCAKRTATLSQQALLSMKAQRQDLKKFSSKLNEEQKILVSQWMTSECQDNFKQFIAKDHW